MYCGTQMSGWSVPSPATTALAIIFIWSCRGTSQKRLALQEDREGDPEWPASHFGPQIGQFFMIARLIIESVRVSQE